MDEGNADSIVRLVLGVARLGEVDLRGWWQCHGLGSAGEYVLSLMLPRTWRMAALELDIASAARRQDEMLQRRSALHLFSDDLPFKRWTLGWLAEEKTRGPDALLFDLASWDADACVERLSEWVGPTSSGGEALGRGLRLGLVSQSELSDGSSLNAISRSLVGAYLHQDTDLAVPYFDLAD